jgi:hypothetical protein
MNIGPFINCYKDPTGYYLDKTVKNNYIYKLCYDESKEGLINENCLIGYSYIILKVKGLGKNRIFYGKNQQSVCSKFKPPDEVYINGYKQSYIHYEYEFKKENNDVILIWKYNNSYMRCGFLDCHILLM